MAARFTLAATGLLMGLIAALSAVWAQPNVRGAPRIWDVELGNHVTDLPDREFVEPACGTNGGPPSVLIGSFENFGRCPQESSGLREILFIYDDELEGVARALRDPILISRYSANTILSQPVILSLLVDSRGLVQGYRIFTDPRAPEELRLGAYSLRITLRARYGRDGWECVDTPPGTGETPIKGTFVNERCEKQFDGMRIAVQSRHYYRRGQALMDPRTNRQTENDFESSAFLEVMRLVPGEGP